MATYKFTLSGVEYFTKDYRSTTIENQPVLQRANTFEVEYTTAEGSTAASCTIKMQGSNTEYVFVKQQDVYGKIFLATKADAVDFAQEYDEYYPFQYLYEVVPINQVLSVETGDNDDTVTVKLGQGFLYRESGTGISVKATDTANDTNTYKLDMLEGVTNKAVTWKKENTGFDVTWTKSGTNAYTATVTQSQMPFTPAGWVALPDGKLSYDAQKNLPTGSYTYTLTGTSSTAIAEGAFTETEENSGIYTTDKVKFVGNHAFIGKDLLNTEGTGTISATISQNTSSILTTVVDSEAAVTDKKAAWAAVESTDETAITDSFNYQSTYKTAGYTFSGTTLTYSNATTATDLFTVSGLTKDKFAPTATAGKVVFNPKVDKNGNTYNVYLTEDILKATAPADDAEEGNTITAQKSSTATGTVTPVFQFATDAATAALPKTKEAAAIAATLTDATKDTDARAYTSPGNETYYAITTANSISTLKITPKVTPKNFSIKGLADSATKDSITYENVKEEAAQGTEGEAGYVAAVPAHYLFTIAPTALNETDILITRTNGTEEEPAIWGAIGKVAAGADAVPDCTKAIASSFKYDKDNVVVTFQAAGYEAGYITAQDLTKATSAGTETEDTKFAKNIHTPATGAAIVYAKQRNGETFTLSGLKATAVTETTSGGTTTYSFAEGGGVTVAEEATNNKITVTVDSTAVNYAKDLVLTRTDVADGVEFEKKTTSTEGTTNTTTAFNEYTLEVASETNKVTTVDTPTDVSGSGTGDAYVNSYAKSFNQKLAATLAGLDNPYLIKEAALSPATISSVAPAEGTNNYTYVSAYSQGFYTKLPEYVETSETMAGDSKKNLIGVYMAGKGQDVYKATSTGHFLSMHTFIINGLKENLDEDAIGEVRPDNYVLDPTSTEYGYRKLGTTRDTSTSTDNESSTTTTKAVVVDYSKGEVIISKAAVVEKVGMEISLGGKNLKVGVDVDGDIATEDTFKLAMAEDNDVDEIEYTVTEGTGENAGTYTVTLSGTTAGFADTDGDGKFTYQAQTGGQQFVITGLKSGLTAAELTEDLFTKEEITETKDGKDTTVGYAWKFAINDNLIQSADGKPNYTDASKITIAYKGITDDPATPATDDDTNDKSTVAFDTDTNNFPMAGEGAKPAEWQQSVDSRDRKIAGQFEYHTATTDFKWTDATPDEDATVAQKKTDTLTFTAAYEGDTLAVFTGLEGITEVNQLAGAAPVYSDANGNPYTRKETTIIKSDETTTTSVVQYTDSTGTIVATFEVDENGNETTTRLTGKDLADNSLGDGSLYDFVFCLPDDARGDSTAKVTYTPGIPTDKNSPYYGTSMHVAFFGKNTTDADGNTVTVYTPAYYGTDKPNETKATFEADTADTTGKTYNYIAPHTDEYYTSTTDPASITVTDEEEQQSTTTLAKLHKDVDDAQAALDSASDDDKESKRAALKTAQDALDAAVTQAAEAATALTATATSYTKQAPAGYYSFTITGLPANIDTSNEDFDVETYFEFTKPTDEGANGVAKVTFTEAAFKSGGNFVDGQTITLSNISLDGNLDGKTDTVKVSEQDKEVTLQVAMATPEGGTAPATSKPTGNPAASLTATTDGLADNATFTTYTYKNGKYDAWYELGNLADNTEITASTELSATYHAATTDTALFTISGLAYNSAGNDDTAKATAKLVTKDATGVITGNVEYNETAGTVTVYKTALAGQDVTVAKADGSTLNEAPTLDFFTVTDYEAYVTSHTDLTDDNKAALKALTVPTTADEATQPGTFAAEGNNYKFTAGYVEAYYDESTGKVTAQAGNPDVITLSGLKTGLLTGVDADKIKVTATAGTGDDAGKTIYTVSIQGTGNTTTNLLNVTYTPATAKVGAIDAKAASYSVALTNDVLAESPTEGETVIKAEITAAVTGDNPTAALNIDGITSKATTEEANLTDADSDGVRTYTTAGNTKGYLLNQDGDTATYTANTQETFTIKGLKSDAKKDAIYYEYKESKHTFDIATSALNEKDIVIKKGKTFATGSIDNITATIDDVSLTTAQKTELYAKEPIAANIEYVSATGFTYTATGYQAGYLTAADVTDDNSQTYSKDIGTHTGAAILYVGKRHGESIQISGLSLSEEARAAATVKADGSVVMPTGVTLVAADEDTPPTFKVAADSLSEGNIELKNVASEGYEVTTAANTETNTAAKYALTTYDLAIEETADIKAIAVTVTTPTEPGTSFIETYETLFNKATADAITNDGQIHTVESLEQNAADTSTTSKTYDYTSSYDKAYFTKLPEYDATAVAITTAMNEQTTNLLGVYMAKENTVTYNYTPATKTTTFSISGLNPTANNVTVGEIFDTNTQEQANELKTNKAVVVDYSNNGHAVTINKVEALPENVADRVDIGISNVKVNGKEAADASTYTISFADSLKSGEAEVMSEDIAFNVVEGTGADAGTYTVTLAGKTPGYVPKEDGTGYTIQKQEGGYQFTITGLRTGLEETLKTAFANLKPVEDAITVPIVQAYLKDSYTNNETAITLTYNGQVNETTANGRKTETTSAAGDSPTFAFDTTNIGNVNGSEAFDAKWTKDADTAGKFVFKQAQTADSFTKVAYDANHTTSLTYAAASGGDDLITLTGLSDTATLTHLEANAYNKNRELEVSDGTGTTISGDQIANTKDYQIAALGFVPCDENGKEYSLETYKEYNAATSSMVYKVRYKDSSDQEVTAANISHYLVKLLEGTFPTTNFNVTYTAGTPDATFIGKTFYVDFNGALGINNLNPTSEALAANEDDSTKTVYDYTSAYTPEYYKATTSGNTTTYEHFAQTPKYTFTISGLPTDTDANNISNYFTFAAPADGNSVAKVTFTADAFKSGGNFVDGQTIALSNISLDGKTDTVKVEQPTGGLTAKTAVSGSVATFNATTPETGATSATYTYTSPNYQDWYELTEKADSATYHAATTATALFTVSGLAYNSAGNDDTAKATAKLVTKDAAGAITGNVEYNETAGTVTVYKTALAGQDVTVAKADGSTLNTAPKLDFFTVTEYKTELAKLTDEAERTAYTNTYEKLAVPTTAEEATQPGTFAAEGNTYKFTAGYVEAYYNESTGEVTAQAGNPDVITLSGLKTGIDLTNAKVETAADGKTFTVKNGDGDALLTVTYTAATTGTNATAASYSVALTDNVLATEPTTGTTVIKAEIAKGTGSTDSANPTAALNIDGITSKSEADKTATLGEADENGVRKYTTEGNTEGYVLSQDSQTATYTAKTQKEFTITGLKSNAAPTAITFDNNTTANTYAFTIAPSALDNATDVFVENSDTTDNKDVTAAIGTAGTGETPAPLGTETISRTLTEANGTVTFTNTGKKAGYLTKDEASTENVTPKIPGAQIVWAEQRGGEHFYVTGLSEDVKTAIGKLDEGVVPDAMVASETVTFTDSATENPATLMTINGGTVTLYKDALGTGTVKFTSDKNSEGTDNYYSVGLDSNVRLVDGITVNVENKTGSAYVEAYQADFDNAVADKVAANTNISKEATIEQQTTEADATSATYDYKSSYTTEYFTKLPTYDATAQALTNAGTGDDFSKLQDIYMASDGATVYTYTPEKSPTEFTIAGLSTTETNVAVSDTDSTAAVYVNNNVVTINSENALAKADTVSLGGASATGYTVDFADSLKSGAAEILSETVEYTVEETKNDGVGTSTYTVTLSGTTEGYDDNKTWQTKSGAKVFTITNLKSDLTADTIKKDLFTPGTNADTGAVTYTFKVTEDMLAKEYNDKAEITIVSNGTVTNTTVHSGDYKLDSTDTVTVAFDASDIKKDAETLARWENDGDTAGSFVFKTARTPSSWSGNNTATLTYTKSYGDDDLIILRGLKATSTEDMPEPVYADASGNALIPVETVETVKGASGIEVYNVESWYNSSDIDDKGEPKANADARVTIKTNDKDSTDTKTTGEPDAYLFDLSTAAFDKAAMVDNAVTYTKNGATDSTFKDKTIVLKFAGEKARTTAPARAVSFTPDTATDATGNTYNYVAAGTGQYFQTVPDADVTNTENIKFVHATNHYGFTIAGLPAGQTSADNLFTFAATEDDTTAYNVTLKDAAFGTEPSESGKVIELSNLDLDGTEDNKTTDITISLAVADNATVNTDKNKVTAVDTLAYSTIPAATDKTASYNYTAKAYASYYTVADDKQSVSYEKERGGELLFTLAGVINTATPDNLIRSTNNALAAITVGEDGEVLLTAGAFNGSDIKLTPKDGKTATLAILDQNYYDTNIANNEDLTEDQKKLYADAILPTDSTAKPGSIKWDATEEAYIFTAGYSPEYYGLDGNTATCSEQIGHADTIVLKGLKQGAIADNDAIAFTKDDGGNYVYTIDNALAITYKLAKEADATTGTAAVTEGYTVALYDAALEKNAAEGTEVTLEINPADDRTGTAPAGEFDISNVTYKQGPTYGSFTADDKDASKYTYVALGTTAGYELAEDDKTTVNYTPRTGCEEFTVTGLKTGLAVEGTADSSIVEQLKAKGVTIDSSEVVLSNDALDNKSITFESDDNFTAALDDKVPQDAETVDGEFTTVEQGTATYKTDLVKPYYEKSDDGFTYIPEVGGAIFQIEGLETTVTKERLNVAEDKPITVEESEVEGLKKVTVTFNDTDIFGKDTIKIGNQPTSYEISMEVADDAAGDVKVADNKEEVAKKGAWDVTSIADGNATFKAGGYDAYYKPTYDESDENKITQLQYQAEVDGKPNLSLGGLNASLTATALSEAITVTEADAETETAATVEITSAIGGANGATITDNTGKYEFVLSAADILTGTDDADTLTAAAKGAFVNGGAGNDQITVTDGGFADGGTGNDTFTVDEGTVVFGEGKDTVILKSDLTVKHDKPFSYEFVDKTTDDDGKITGGDILLSDNAGNTLLLKGAAGKTVNFQDADGVTSEMAFDTDINDVFTFSNDLKGVTVKSAYEGTTVGPNEFAAKNASTTIVTINAAQATLQGLEITGTANNNVIIGTDSDDTIDAGESTSISSNTVTGGTGSDVFKYRGGKLTINDFTVNDDDTDEIELIGDKKVSGTKVSGNNLTFEVGDGSIELKDVFKSAASVEVAISDADGENTGYTYTKAGLVDGGTEVTLMSNYKGNYTADEAITDITAYNTVSANIDASKTTKGVNIDASKSTAANTLLGGQGSDTLAGATDKADLFVYDGKGADEVTNFEAADKVSLTGVDMSNITAVSVTADNKETADTDESAVKLSFGGTNSLNLKGAKDTVTVNGTAYTFEDNAYLDARKTGITLTSGATGGFDASGEAYSSIVSIDASAVTSTFSITGNAKDNVISAAKGGGSVTGGDGKDLFVFNGGAAAILDYSVDDKDSISIGGGLTLSNTLVSGKDVVLTYGEGNTLTITDGADQNLTFVEGKKSYMSIFSDLGTFNDNHTAVTLAAGVTKFNVADTAYTKVSTIVASSVTAAGAQITAGNTKSLIDNTGNATGLTLTGGAGNDTINAGTGDKINGGDGNDIVNLATGNGADTVVIGAGGTDSVKNFDAGTDQLSVLKDAKLSDAAISTKKGVSNLELTLTTPAVEKGKTSTSKVIVENISTEEDGSAKVSVDAAVWTFGEDRIEAGKKVILTSKYNSKNAYEAPNTATEVDASATKGVTLSGGDANGVTLTGSEKGADTFVYDGGNDSITNYGKGSDKISLSGYTMSDLTAVSVDADDSGKGGTVVLSFYNSKITTGTNHESLSVHVEDATKAVTIADDDTPKGTAYTFQNDAIAVGKAITVLSGDDTLDVATATAKDGSLNAYTSIALNYTATVTAAPKGSNVTLLKGGEITGDAGKDTLKAGGGTVGATLKGAKAADTFIYDGGNVTVTDYSATDKDIVSIASGWNVSNITVGDNGTTLDLLSDNGNGTLILENVKEGTEVQFATASSKATKSYFSKGMILDGNDKSKVKSAIAVGEANFGTIIDKTTRKSDNPTILETGTKNAEDLYKSLVTITSGGTSDNPANVTGNSKNNIINLATGGSVKGGIGNDTYIIGGAATIGDFGINAKTILNDGSTGLIKLPTKVNTVGKETVKAGAAAEPAYSADAYAPGKDKIQISNGTIVSIGVDGLTEYTDSKNKDLTAVGSFNVTLNVDGSGNDTYSADDDGDYQVVLQNIRREAKNNKGTYVSKNTEYKDFASLQIYELNEKGKYVQVKAAALIDLANGDAPDFGSADLDDIMDVTPAVTTGDSGTTKDADSFIITGGGDDSSDTTSKQK